MAKKKKAQAYDVDFHAVKRALDRGSVSPIEALFKWTAYALKKPTLELKPYFEYVRDTLPSVVWHKSDEELLVRGYVPVTWTCPTDFYKWADDFMGDVFTMGAHLRRYIGEHDPEHAEVVLEEILVKLGQHGGDRGNQYTGGKCQVDNVNLIHDGGNSKAYTLARLQRDRPDLLKRVNAGELSANAAAIEAGFRKKPTPMDTAKKAIKKLSAAERTELISWMEELDDDAG